MFKFLDGYKMYLVAAALAIVVVVEKLAGFDVPGISMDDNWLELLFTALGFGALKSAIKKAE